MKYGTLDLVSVLAGKLAGETGQIVGASQLHIDSKPQMAEYQVTFRHLNITEEYKEDRLLLVEKHDKVRAEKERLEAVAKKKADLDEIAERKMHDALRKKLEKEFEIREQLEKEYAAKKAT